MQYTKKQRLATEDEYKKLNKETSNYNIKLAILEKKIKIFKFIDNFGLSNYLENVHDIELTNSYNKSNIGEFNFSYIYNKSNNQVNHIKFKVKYSNQHSYENNINTYIESTLDVTNTSDLYYIDHAEGVPCTLYINGDELEAESWGYLLGKIIDIICGSRGTLYRFLDFK